MFRGVEAISSIAGGTGSACAGSGHCSTGSTEGAFPCLIASKLNLTSLHIVGSTCNCGKPNMYSSSETLHADSGYICIIGKEEPGIIRFGNW